LLHAISCGKGHGGVSKKRAKSQVWLPSGVTRAAGMARTSLMLQQLFLLKSQHENSKTPP